jgi:hypothetical protein
MRALVIRARRAAVWARRIRKYTLRVVSGQALGRLAGNGPR